MSVAYDEGFPGHSDVRVGLALLQNDALEAVNLAAAAPEAAADIGQTAAALAQIPVPRDGDRPTLAIVPEAHDDGEADRSKEVFRLWRDPDTYEVHVESDITLEDYKRVTRPEDWELLEQFAEQVRGKSMVFLNPTYEGGGVAMLRPPLVHMLKQLGVDAHWFVMAPMQDESRGNPFKFTKLMHNISQRQAGDERITEEGKALHQAWGEENLEVLGQQPEILSADILVYDDPQPLALKRGLDKLNPRALRVWRNHIDTDRDLMADPTTPQGEVAHYLLYELGLVDVEAAVAHPVEQFVHHELSSLTFLAPATTDPFDDLNRELSEGEIAAGIQFINGEIAEKNYGLAMQGRYEDMQPYLDADPSKRRITLIARFDESKGMDKAMELGVRARKRLRALGVPEAELPEVVIVGNGSVDDPSGVPMYEKMLKLRRERYPDEMHGITLMRLRHNYGAMSALMYRSTIITQTSTAEGWESRMTDAIEHGVPVIGSNRGGIPKQIIEGESGFVLDYDKPDFDLGRGAEIIAGLLTDRGHYDTLVASTKRAAHEFNRREITTTANVTRWLKVFAAVLATERGVPVQADRIWQVRHMLAAGALAATQG